MALGCVLPSFDILILLEYGVLGWSAQLAVFSTLLRCVYCLLLLLLDILRLFCDLDQVESFKSFVMLYTPEVADVEAMD